MSRVIVWFSRGAASAVAGAMALKEYDDCVFAYCATGAEHPDSDRFEEDVKRWLGVDIVHLKSKKYADTWAVWESRSYLAGIDGAPCTGELKIKPREVFQRPDDIHVFGYTADAPDVKRANRLRLNYPDMRIEAPLIHAGITKEGCLAMIENAGIRLPEPYLWGLPNNNCIPCVKATSPAYWALIRKHEPEKFDRMAKLSRRLDVRLCRIKDERRFIDEIPEDQPTTAPMVPSCDFLCALAEMGLEQ